MIDLFPDQETSIIANSKENISQIVAQSRELGATVILSRIFPLGKMPIRNQLTFSPQVAVAISEVNEFIRSLEEEGVIIFDTLPILTNEEGIVRPPYSRDALHLNRAGYEALNVALLEVLASLA